MSYRASPRRVHRSVARSVAEIAGNIDTVYTGNENGALLAHYMLNEIVSSDAVAADAPVIQKAASQTGDEQVRNRGTIGGNVAHADPASDLPAAVIAAGAEIVAQGPDGERVFDADDFYVGMYETALGGDELVTSIRVPNRAGETVGA